MTRPGRGHWKSAFILQNIRLRRLPYLPELKLYLADEIGPLWRAVEEMDQPLPYWAFAWVGGQAVARYLLDRPEQVAGKRALDLAAGSGVCAIAAMKAGAAQALAADVDSFCEQAIALNARANGVSVAFTGRDLLDAEPPDTDLIVAGDVCYERAMAGRVLAWLWTAHNRGIHVLLGDPGRPYFPRAELTQLVAYDVPASLELEDSGVKRVGVFTFPAYDRRRTRRLLERPLPRGIIHRDSHSGNVLVDPLHRPADRTTVGRASCAGRAIGGEPVMVPERCGPFRRHRSMPCRHESGFHEGDPLSSSEPGRTTMAFDIHQRIFEDGDYDEDAALEYRDAIMVRFSTSPEGEEVTAKTGAVGWADTFMDYGMGYLGVTPPEMSPSQVEEILFDIFPRKVSAMPGAGEEIIPGAPRLLDLLAAGVSARQCRGMPPNADPQNGAGVRAGDAEPG